MNSVNATDGANKENRGVNMAEEECQELVGDRKDTLRRNLKAVESMARDKMWPHKKFVTNADKHPNTFFYNLFIGFLGITDKTMHAQQKMWEEHKRVLEKATQRKRASVCDKMKVNFFSKCVELVHVTLRQTPVCSR